MTGRKIENQSNTTPSAQRRYVEELIDDIVAQSFPASDPPAWGVVASLLEQERAAKPA